MQEWFKYEFGYVNIDSENLYLTNSGNWSDTKGLPEKARSNAGNNSSKSTSIIIFLIVMVMVFGFFILKSLMSGRIAITLIALLVFGGYKTYEFLKSGIGSKFKIPIAKISEIKQYERTIEIFFVNGEDENDSYKLHLVDEKGIRIMNSLKF